MMVLQKHMESEQIMKKSVVCVMVLAILLCLVFTGCGQKNDPQQPHDSEMEASQALAFAEELIYRYETYVNLGIACDFDYNYAYTEEEIREIRDLLSDEQRLYLASPQRCICCTTYEQAKAHTLRCIDESLLEHITEDYVIYQDVLYFFMGNKGGLTYHNVRLKEFSDAMIVATADLHNSGGLYEETQVFTIVQTPQGYKLTEIALENP